MQHHPSPHSIATTTRSINPFVVHSAHARRHLKNRQHNSNSSHNMLRHIAKRLPTYRNTTATPQHRTLSSSATASTAPDRTSGDEQPINEQFAHLRSHSVADGFVWSSAYGRIERAAPAVDMTLDEYVWKNVAKWQHKIAIVCGITGRRYTYAKLRDHSAAVARRLRADYALQRGDVIAICMPNVPEYAIVLLGALEAGVTVTPVNPAYTPAEQARQLEAAQPRLVFGLVENVDTVRDALKEWRKKVPMVALRTHRQQTVPEGVRDLAEMMEVKTLDLSEPFAQLHQPADVCLLPFSSGTMGAPKGVQLTHHNLTANCEQCDQPLPERRMMLPTTNDFQDVVPCVLPFYHMYGLSFLLLSKLALGCKLVTLPRFDAAALVQVLAEHRATFLPLVPPLMWFLARDERVGERHLYSVRQVICGAAASGVGDMERLKEKSPSMQFMQGYGMVESSPVTLLSQLPCSNYASIGRPVASTEAKIVSLDLDPSGLQLGLGAGQTGELLVRGPQIMHGYLNDAEATAAAISADGWLRTGDVAEYDANGEFYVRDRVKEVLKVNGQQVAPAELEEVLRSHPLVLDAAVVGVPDERVGERPRAFVAVRSRVAGEELEKWVADRVAGFKRLSGGVQLVAEVPRSATGKIQRRELKRLYL